MVASAERVVEVEFDAGVWTDVTAFARSATIRRGRTGPLGTVTAGSASVVLDNRDRRFDPRHSTGPHYGKLLPRKRIRVGMTYGATTYWRFCGYVHGWPQAYGAGGRDGSVNVVATDAFKLFAGAYIPSAWVQSVASLSPTAWWRLGESSGTAMMDSSGNKRHGTYEGGVTFNSRAGLVANDSDNALQFDGTDDVGVAPALLTAYPFTIEGWFTMAAADLAGSYPIIYYQEAPGGHVRVAMNGPTAPGIDGVIEFAIVDGATMRVVETVGTYHDGEPHLFQAVATSASNITIYVDGVEDSIVSTVGSPAFPTGATQARIGTLWVGILDEIVLYADDLSEPLALAHYNAGSDPWAGDTPAERFARVLDYVGWSATDRDIDAGSASLTPAALDISAIEHLQLVETSEGGRFFIDRNGKVSLVGRSEYWSESVYRVSNATLSDNPTAGQLRYTLHDGDLFEFDDSQIINEARVRSANGTEQIVVDTDSQDDYGLVSHVETSLESRPVAARGRAEYLVATHAQPAWRVPRVVISPERDPATIYPVVLAADLGYRYTIVNTPLGLGATITEDVQLEGITETIKPGSHVIEWDLSPGELPFFVWGVSTWGETTRWGY